MIYVIVVVILLLAYAGVACWALNAVNAEAVLLSTLLAGVGGCALVGSVQILLHAGGGPVPSFATAWSTAVVLIAGALAIFGIALRFGPATTSQSSCADTIEMLDGNATATDLEGCETSRRPRL